MIVLVDTPGRARLTPTHSFSFRCHLTYDNEKTMTETSGGIATRATPPTGVTCRPHESSEELPVHQSGQFFLHVAAMRTMQAGRLRLRVPCGAAASSHRA